ncbi:MAG: hypothetical protein CTY37_02295 [Methylotenera sp.]|nr:MAG: hypothetical protein CTY37_02295 [Methylotenera sp.]PPD12707.1 MAG: hypothetical protein CTY27_06465 [Methylotenera sp.]
MKFTNILLGITLFGFSSLSLASLCADATVMQGMQVRVFDFVSINGNQLIDPNPQATCQLNENPNNQNSGNIGNLLGQVFDLDKPLTFLQQANVGNGEAQGLDEFNISGLNAFNYLAVHYGTGELFFKFANPITGFTITGLSNALSNYRTYTDGNPSAVPLPAAGWLFGSALIGLMGLRRKMH